MLDRFFVPQKDIPPKEILIVFLFIHLTVLLFLFITYLYIHDKLSFSDSQAANLTQSKTLFYNLRMIYLGLGLIVLDNVITHFYALLSNDNAYFSVGARSTLVIIGFALFFIYVSRFLKEVLRVPKSFNPKPMPYIRTMKYGYLSIFLIILILIPIGIETWVISMVFVISTGLMGIFFTFEFYVIFSTQLTDQVNRLRTIIAGFLGVGMIALLFFTINFLPNKSIPASDWPTRDARVEILLFGTDLWVFYTSTMIILIVTLPRNLRLIFDISDEEFNLYRDERLDLDWNKLRQWEFMEVSKNPAPIDLSKVIFTDYDLNGKGTSEIFSENLVLSIDDFQDPYVENYVKDSSELVLIVSHDFHKIGEVLEIINDYYDFKLQMNENLQVNSFVYQLEGYSCGMLVCIPSFWNSSNKLWILFGSEENISGLIKLYSEFTSFFAMVAEEEQIFAVAKFPLINLQISNIGSIPNDPEVPDFRNLIFL